MKIPIFNFNLPTGLVAALALTAVLAAGCSRKSSGSAPGRGTAAVPVLVAKVTETNIPVQLKAIGNVMPYSRVTIRSQITGQLTEVHFKEGQEVKQGDLLFTMDPRPPEAALEQARADLVRDQAQLENAQIEFERSSNLFQSKVMAQADFDTAKATLDSAQGTVLADRAAITNAILNLGYTSIRSPLDGVVGSQLVYAGNIIKSPDDQMLMINQIHPIYVQFSVPENYLAEIRHEMAEGPLKVNATFDGFHGGAPEGKLTFVDNMVDTTTGTIALKATFPNEDSVLWPGQFVQVEMVLSDLPRALVVPSQAIQTGQDGDYVFVVKPDDTAEMRPVKIGPSYKNDIVVTDGLRAGETVVTDGQLNLITGTKVDLKSSAADGVAGDIEQP